LRAPPSDHYATYDGGEGLRRAPHDLARERGAAARRTSPKPTARAACALARVTCRARRRSRSSSADPDQEPTLSHLRAAPYITIGRRLPPATSAHETPVPDLRESSDAQVSSGVSSAPVAHREWRVQLEATKPRLHDPGESPGLRESSTTTSFLRGATRTETAKRLTGARPLRGRELGARFQENASPSSPS
jgi:hypothetical protein